MNHVLDDYIFNNYVVIGVSAGPDSMCLLDLLQKKTTKIVVCHINHNVRKESIEEEEYITKYCQDKNIILEKTTINNYQENNFENEARKKRYIFYEEILKKYNSKTLLLAHHGDDLIETILMKISRGSNLEGYAGIKEVSNVKNYQIIRPLLKYTKEDIINYNKSNNIKYYNDSSNQSTNYTRNRYRLNILPLLKKEDKNIHKKYLKYSKTLIEYDDYIKREVKRNINNVYKDNIINIDNLNKLDTFLIKNILYNIMNNIYQNKNNIITDRHIQNIISLLNNTKPNIKIDLPNNKEIVKEYNKLIIKDKTSDIKNYKIEFNDKIEIENLIIEKIESEDDDSNSVCRLNSKDITLPLYIRNREDGDYIILKGSNNRKKIKEIFIEKKLPLNKRNNYPLLVDSNNNIIWIPNIKKSKFCNKKSENYDIIIRCNERKEDYE
ncbi:MAG: tRNA lysidine(34) synthetase TilS [Bacilli bacterium]|nr:tRNA lysidine(34) synthetase TilS [Bacilli bacterium]